MVRILITYLFLVVNQSSFAQVTNQWVSTFSGDDYDELRNITHDTEGNLLIAGHYEGMITIADTTYVAEFSSKSGLIIKTDMEGEIIWSKELHAGEFSEIDIFKILPEPSGGFYIAGSVYGSTVDIDPSAEESNLTADGDNILVGQYDSEGNLIWANSYRFTPTSDERAFDMDIDQNGNLYVVGYFDVSASSDDDDMVLLSLNAQGEINWVYSAQPDGRLDDFSSVCVRNEFVYAVGNFTGTADFDNSEAGEEILQSTPDETSSIIAKFDLNGSLIWVKQLKGEGSITGKSLVVNEFGEIYLGGSYGENIDFDPGSGTNIVDAFISEPFVLKLDSDGNFDWVWTYDGSQVRRVILTNDGGVYFGGDGASTFFGQLSRGGDLLFLTDLVYENSPNSSNADLKALSYNGNGGLVIGVEYFFGFQYQPNGQEVIESNGERDFALASYNVGLTKTKEKLLEISITSYPNPVIDKVNIHWSKKKVRKIEVMDVSGHKLNTIYAQPGRNEIQIAIPYPSGNYLINLEGKGFTKSVKIIKI